MKSLDAKIQEVKALQAELDSRTEAENEAIRLISECRFDEARKILNGSILGRWKGEDFIE